MLCHVAQGSHDAGHHGGVCLLQWLPSNPLHGVRSTVSNRGLHPWIKGAFGVLTLTPPTRMMRGTDRTLWTVGGDPGVGPSQRIVLHRDVHSRPRQLLALAALKKNLIVSFCDVRLIGG